MKPSIKYPRSEKVYVQGKLFPEIRVGMRKVEQVPSSTFNEKGERIVTPNPDIYIYDTSGPFSDPSIKDFRDSASNGYSTAAMWSNCLKYLPSTEECAATTSPSIISVLNI